MNALVSFDREEQKEYRIPISISDSGAPQMTGTSYLTVIIGDENDNPMKEGSSSIFVFFLKGHQTDTQIGRVYVDDPDDWDLPDKKFSFDMNRPYAFQLDSKTGMLTVTSEAEAGIYPLRFKVSIDEARMLKLRESHICGMVDRLKKFPQITCLKVTR